MEMTPKPKADYPKVHLDFCACPCGCDFTGWTFERMDKTSRRLVCNACGIKQTRGYNYTFRRNNEANAKKYQYCKNASRKQCWLGQSEAVRTMPKK